MFKTTLWAWFWLSVGSWAALSACGGDAEKSGASSGLGGTPNVGGSAPQSGGTAGESLVQGGNNGSGGESPTAGTGGTGGTSVAERAQAAVDSYVPTVHTLGVESCTLQSALPCYPGDQSCIDMLDKEITPWMIATGCIPEDLATATCLAALTVDRYECVDGYPSPYPYPKIDACAPEMAASGECPLRWDRMKGNTTTICSLQAARACFDDGSQCETTIKTESAQYGNLGCGAERDRLLICLANLTEYTFDCRPLFPYVPTMNPEPYPCQAAHAELDDCAR